MTSPSHLLKEALRHFDRDGTFTEQDYQRLRAVLERGMPHGRAAADLLDGLCNLFFERHLLSAKRRKELLALEGAALEKAVVHRFRQVVADEHPDQNPYRALRSHLREVLDELRGKPPPREPSWPAAIRESGHFVREKVRAALGALSAERGGWPELGDATGELFHRYLKNEPPPEPSPDVPEALRMRIDGQRLAAGILAVLTAEEKNLLRHLLEDGSVEEWAAQVGCSRATAYRLMARLKALCRLEFSARSNGTRLEALQALRGGL